MFAVIVAAAIVAIVILLLLARYAQDPAEARQTVDSIHDAEVSDPIEPDRLFQIVQLVFERMGLVVERSRVSAREATARMEAVSSESYHPARYLIYVVARPGGEEVGAASLLRIADEVGHSDATRGVVVTPYRIDPGATAGIETELDLIDGMALLALVEEHAPELSTELRTHALRGVTPPRTTTTAPAPRFEAAAEA